MVEVETMFQVKLLALSDLLRLGPYSSYSRILDDTWRYTTQTVSVKNQNGRAVI